MNEPMTTNATAQILPVGGFSLPLTGPDAIARRKEQARAEYRRVVLSLAAGDDPGDVDLEPLLFAVQKSFDQMENDLEMIRQRMRSASQIEETEQLKVEEQATNDELSEVRKEAERISLAYKQTIEPILQNQRRLQERSTELRQECQVILEHAQRSLRRTSDPAIDDELARLQQKSSELLDQMQLLREQKGIWPSSGTHRMNELQSRVQFGQATSDNIAELQRLQESYKVQVEIPNQLRLENEAILEQMEQVQTRKLDWECFAL